MSKRTGRQIRAYCKAADAGPWCWVANDKDGGWALGTGIDAQEKELAGDISNADLDSMMLDLLAEHPDSFDTSIPRFIANARTDLPRVLNAAIALWRARYTDREMMLRQAAARLAESDDMELSEDEIRQRVLDDRLLSSLAWLEEEDDAH